MVNQIREQVAAALTAADLKAIDYVAEITQSPVCIVVPGDPYVSTEDVPFGQVNVNITVLVIGGKGTSKAATSQLDTLIVQALNALDDYDVTEVSSPGQVNLNGHTFLGAAISISETTKL